MYFRTPTTHTPSTALQPPQRTPWPARDHNKCDALLKSLIKPLTNDGEERAANLSEDEQTTIPPLRTQQWTEIIELLHAIEECRPQHLYLYLGAAFLDEDLLKDQIPLSDWDLRNELPLVWLAIQTLHSPTLYPFVVKELLRMGAAPIEPRLIPHGRDPDDVINKSWQWRMTLGNAARASHFDVVEFVLAMYPRWVNCAVPKAPNDHLWRPIHQVSEVISTENGVVNQRAVQHLKHLLALHANPNQILEDDGRKPAELLRRGAPDEVAQLYQQPVSAEKGLPKEENEN
eukprot:TRINITY_DN61488_c0_g1_i3.p1 TRINITY_DN61488_c0_g1~~TRINITY_DN61488_c0_g1_i3.p1  ORF type:complete len:288 (+),score=24.21 TRINITY_DN61488_c0_g1_i3:125-988(+)